MPSRAQGLRRRVDTVQLLGFTLTKCWATTSAVGPATHKRLVHAGSVMATSSAGTIGYAGLLWRRRRGGDGRCLLVIHHAFRARVPLSNDPCEGATPKRHTLHSGWSSGRGTGAGGGGVNAGPLYESKLFKYRLKMVIWHQQISIDAQNHHYENGQKSLFWALIIARDNKFPPPPPPAFKVLDPSLLCNAPLCTVEFALNSKS